jgi:hypothetical protein
MKNKIENRLALRDIVFVTTFFVSAILLSISSCKKNVGDIVLTPTEDTVISHKEVKIQLTSDNNPCVEWRSISGPSYKVVSGGGDKDKFITITYDTTGISLIEAEGTFCKGGDCSGNRCQNKNARTTIIVQ